MIVMDTFDLSTPVQVETGLLFVDLANQDLPFPLEDPHSWQNLCSQKNLRTLLEAKVVVLDLSINLFLHRDLELGPVGFFVSLVEIENIRISMVSL